MAILSISYEFGSHAEEIGHAIETELGYEYIALGRIHHEAKQAGRRWERFTQEYGEARPNIWERFDWSFMGFMALIQSTILDYTLRDQVVIMARAANYLLTGIPHALRIRVEAPEEKRIEWLMMKESLNRDLAAYRVRQADRETVAVIHQLYGKKWDDPDAYEVKYDTRIQPSQQIINTVKSLLAAKDQLKTTDSQNKLKMRALAAKIRATILTNPDFLIPTLEVEPVGNRIILRGIARSIKEHRAIDKVVKELSGDTQVVCEIHYRGIMTFRRHIL